MEFLRFGSSIPGGYWGCCAMDIIQYFKVDPDAKASIQLVNGDAGSPMMRGSEFLFLGATYREIFKQRLRINTFDTVDKPNHGFLAVLTAEQCRGGVGKKWLEILKEEGFEFIRAVDNSVYQGPNLLPKGQTHSGSSHINYLFGLFRNIGTGAVENPFQPPKEWTDMKQVVPEAYQAVTEGHEVMKAQQAYYRQRWEASSPTKFMTKKELEAQGVPITMAGLRSKFPQQLESFRQQAHAREAKTPAPSAFPAKTATAA